MDFNNSYKGTLISGIEIEIVRMKGEHQDAVFQILKGTYKSENKKLKDIEGVVADRILRLGEYDFRNMDHAEKVQHLTKLASSDYKMALLLIRFFTCDIHFEERQNLADEIEQLPAPELDIESPELYETQMREYEEKKESLKLKLAALEDHKFTFNYEYESKKENTVVDHNYEVVIHLHDFKKTVGAITGKTIKEVTAQRQRELTLPLTKKLFRWNVLDVATELKFKDKFDDMDDITLSAIVEIRGGNIMEQNSKGTGLIPLVYNFAKGEYLDNEAIRIDIGNVESRIDTTIALKHPETKQMFKVDILGSAAFFFPSGVLR